MGRERFLVTGAAGCIAVWVLRNLVRERVPVAAFDLEEKIECLSLILDDREISQYHRSNCRDRTGGTISARIDKF